MWYTYVFKSRILDRYYIGYTRDLDKRLRWHNEGKGRWSKRYKPWEIVYVEDYDEKSDAIIREKQLKVPLSLSKA